MKNGALNTGEDFRLISCDEQDPLKTLSVELHALRAPRGFRWPKLRFVN